MVNINSAIIVEDDPDWMEILKGKFSSKFNCRIVGKGNLYDAVEAINKESFDLYVSCGGYPLKHGDISEEGASFRFYDELMKINPEARFVIISGRIENEDKARELGIICYNRGNFTVDDLAERLDGS